jgi:hypothetical protein
MYLLFKYYGFRSTTTDENAQWAGVLQMTGQATSECKKYWQKKKKEEKDTNEDEKELDIRYTIFP